MIENENVVADKAHQEVGHHFGRDVQGLENRMTKGDVLHVPEGQELTTGFDTTGKPCLLVIMNNPGKGG